MKKLLFLILFIFLSSNIIYAQSSLTIKTIDETSQTNKKETSTKTNTNKNINNSKSIHIPYTGWFQIPNTIQWVYFIRDNLATGWQYITGNGWDGWYYFDNNSFLMLQNTWTPDGYFVDATGKWVENYKGPSTNNNITIDTSSGEIINNNTNNNVKDSSSKYLYNRVEYTANSKSITNSITLDGETLKKNIIRFTNDGSITIPNTNKYTKLIFDYLIQEPNENNEYNLQILVNDELEDELNSFVKNKQSYILEFEENSKIQFKWFVNTEDGNKSANAINLYIYNGILYKE